MLIDLSSNHGNSPQFVRLFDPQHMQYGIAILRVCSGQFYQSLIFPTDGSCTHLLFRISSPYSETLSHPHSHSLQPAVISWWVLVVPFRSFSLRILALGCCSPMLLFSFSSLTWLSHMVIFWKLDLFPHPCTQIMLVVTFWQLSNTVLAEGRFLAAFALFRNPHMLFLHTVTF